MTKSSSGAEGSAAKQVHLQTASGSRTSSLCIASIEGEAVEGARRDLRARQPSSTSRSVKLARARPGGATKHLPPPARSSSAAQERRPAVRAEPRRTSKRSKADGRDPPLVQADLDEITAADLNKIAAFSPFKQDSKSPTADISLPIEQARNQRVVIGTPARRAMAEARRETKTYPPEPTYFKLAGINLTSGHSRRHPVEATKSSEVSLFDIDNKNRARSRHRFVKLGKKNGE